mmetsp:Transcript_37881/g.98003  ORF Transcript_37881/g.98003 Transcript_37881/m.98003 type:complete len:199 (+) Transcript_37881:62-658(+)
MAINPVLAQDQATNELFPLPQAGESFVLKRDNIHFACRLPSGQKLKGTGVFFLSSTRIVFLAKTKSSRADFKSFEIPLTKLDKPRFHQPIFGANYLGGVVYPAVPDAGGPLAGGRPTSVSLTFYSGGCGTFLPRFYQIMSQIQKEAAESEECGRSAEPTRPHEVAFVDPSDPSVLFIAQPQAVPDSEEHTTFDASVRR